MKKTGVTYAQALRRLQRRRRFGRTALGEDLAPSLQDASARQALTCDLPLTSSVLEAGVAARAFPAAVVEVGRAGGPLWTRGRRHASATTTARR